MRNPPAWERLVRVGLRTLVSAMASASRSPLLAVAAVMLIALFTISLALADPHSDSGQVLAARSVTAGAISLDNRPALVNDSSDEAEAAIFSAPAPQRRYHDRYRFYHRYELYPPRTRFNPLDDGVN